MREHGAAHGLQKYADAIKVGKDGRFGVTDPALRQEILALRKDPDTAALMAGELTNDMQQSMQSALGRGVSSGELYIAHFLGPQAAVKLVKAAAESPSTAAATLFPDAAASNQPIFYRKDGTPRTVSAVLENLKSRHEGTSTPATLYAQAPSALENNTPSSLLRGTTGSGLGLPAVSGNNALDGFGLDGMVMSPLVAQLLASMDAPGFADAFNPDSTEPSRTRKS
jgi:hypothetical protein